MRIDKYFSEFAVEPLCDERDTVTGYKSPDSSEDSDHKEVENLTTTDMLHLCVSKSKLSAGKCSKQNRQVNKTDSLPHSPSGFQISFSDL